MKSIRVTMPDDVFLRLKKRARSGRHPGIASMLLAAVGEANEVSETMDIVKQAIKLAQRKESGERFRLRDLFEARKWGDLDKGVRIRAGRKFYACVLAKEVDVKPEKGEGHQWYVRTLGR